MLKTIRLLGLAALLGAFSFQALADESSWTCVAKDIKTRISVELTVSGKGGSVNLRRDLVTRRGTVPKGNYTTTVNDKVFSRPALVWSFDVSDYIPEFQEGDHDYGKAEGLASLENIEGGKGLIEIRVQEKSHPWEAYLLTQDLICVLN